jgi:hypothetical protein
MSGFYRLTECTGYSTCIYDLYFIHFWQSMSCFFFERYHLGLYAREEKLMWEMAGAKCVSALSEPLSVD